MPIYNTTSSTFGSSIIGQLPAGTAPIGSVAVLQGTMPWTIGSIYGNISGSVAGFIVGNASLITIFQSSSVIAVSTGSVISVPSGSVITVLQNSSIIALVTGSVASAGAQSSSIYGMRNDAIASFLGADLTTRPIATDSAGRSVIKPFASEDATIISYVGSVVSGSVTLIQASAVGKKSYITDFSLNNSGSTTTLLTIQGGDTSLLGQFIVPAGGGNNKVWQIPLKTTLSQDLAFKVSPSQSVLYATIKGYQAP